MSDHDYCRSPLTVSNVKTNDNTHENVKEVMTPFSGVCKIIPRPVTIREKKIKVKVMFIFIYLLYLFRKGDK